MGKYNPHASIIVGQEWVPIRQADFEPDQITEQGYTLQLDTATAVVSGAFWAAFPPEKIVNYVAETINIYPAGVEDRTGPIRRVVIPVSNVQVTGNGEFLIDSGAFAWTNPSDNATQELTTFVGLPALGLNFAVEQFTQELQGKRILGVRFLYTAGTNLNGTLDFVDFGVASAVDGGTGSDHYNIYQSFAEGPAATSSVGALALVTDLKFVDLGNVNVNIATPISSFGDPSALALPWRYDELLLFSTSTPLATRRVLLIRPNNFFIIDELSGTVDFGYGALEVFYCEETRVRIGGRYTALNMGIGGRGTINEGVNLVPLRDLSFNAPAALAAGEYLVTTGHHEVKPTFIARGAPKLRRLRQLYEIYTHRGRTIDTRVIEGAEFSSTPTDEITAITLHTATSIVTGSHAYGTNVGAPVYGSKTPIQEVINLNSTDVTVTQVRFYARRFGDTVVPLSFSTSGFGFVTKISVAEFDALPEIVDGWREVNLRLPLGSTMTGGGTSAWLWSAIGEAAGNQWQILAASNPAGPRVATPAVAATGPATYTPPLGVLLELNWQSPPISGTADDSTTDAVLLLSTEPPAVTGFAVSTTSQAITGVGQFCGTDPRCVPTAILGNRLSWSPFGVCDDWQRIATDTWGVATSGQTWVNSGGAASDYDVVNGLGQHTLTSVTVARNSTITTAQQLTSATVEISVSQVAVGDNIIAGPGLGSDSDNMYQARLLFQTGGTLSLEVIKRLAAAQASLGSFGIGAYSANQEWTVELIRRPGNFLEARAWPTLTGSRPVVAQVMTYDTSTSKVTSFPAVILRSVLGAANTNVNPMVMYDNLVVTTEGLTDGALEIQRRDSLTDWQTIMLSSLVACGTSFNDFEARVGVLSEYRMRTLNAMDFAGPWVTGSGTIASPGVTVGGDGNSLLIMTSNESPSASLAYTMQWDGQPVEQFIFPEVDTLQLQRMFGRNFLTAFHPLERSGEQFSRVLLVNAAAVALPSLGNFRSLRDLGWADLNYVCVRDELGNRWFANVAVPEGSVRMNRTIYLAEVRITEVTDTPTPVDPGGAS